MYWRLSRKVWTAQKDGPNREALARLVKKGRPPGILAYRKGEPIGWCAIAPRSDYPALARSRILLPVDALEVWSITCLFVRRADRRQGVSVALIEAATRWAGSAGARVVEGYPVEPRGESPDPFVWTGTASAFRRAGFTEVARRSPTRPIMRARVGRRRRAANSG